MELLLLNVDLGLTPMADCLNRVLLSMLLLLWPRHFWRGRTACTVSMELLWM